MISRIMAIRGTQLYFDVMKIAVGPSAPPIIPITAELSLNDKYMIV
jgi:hypothetical protein